MKSLYQLIITILLIFFNAIMLIFPKEIMTGARAGLLQWYNNVLPSLFPFMVFTSLLMATSFPEWLGGIMTPICKGLFKISGTGAFGLLVGMVAGCPLGAKNLCEMYTDGLITKSEAERLVIFANNTGPVFIIGAVGEGMLGGSHIGVRILTIEYISALIMGLILRGFAKEMGEDISKRVARGNPFQVFTRAVSSGVTAITMVGGFITLFSVISAILTQGGIMELITRPLVYAGMDEYMSMGLIWGILEITGGMGLLAQGDLCLPLLSALAAWGGLSIHCQSAVFITECGLSVKKYIAGKAVQGIIALGLGFIL